MYVVETWAVRAMMWIHVHLPCTLCSMYLLYVAADQAARIRGGGGGGLQMQPSMCEELKRKGKKKENRIYTRSLAQPVVITVGVA